MNVCFRITKMLAYKIVKNTRKTRITAIKLQKQKKKIRHKSFISCVNRDSDIYLIFDLHMTLFDQK